MWICIYLQDLYSGNNILCLVFSHVYYTVSIKLGFLLCILHRTFVLIKCGFLVHIYTLYFIKCEIVFLSFSLPLYLIKCSFPNGHFKMCKMGLFKIYIHIPSNEGYKYIGQVFKKASIQQT